MEGVDYAGIEDIPVPEDPSTFDDVFSTYIPEKEEASKIPSMIDDFFSPPKKKTPGFLEWLWSGTGGVVVDKAKSAVSYLFWGIVILGILALLILIAGTRFMGKVEG